jgi:hypothetical protein
VECRSSVFNFCVETRHGNQISMVFSRFTGQN